MGRLFLGDGGAFPAEAQAAYEAAEKLSQEAYVAAMAGAPERDKRLLGKASPERQAFIDRADAAYAAIEGPAREILDAQYVAGPRPEDYSIGLGESEIPAKDWK